MRLFLYGTLCDGATLERRAGAPGLAAQARPARLPGYRRVTLRGDARWPTLERAPGGAVDGMVVGIGAAALRRLSAYEGPAYRLRRVVVRTADGETSAMTWIASGATRRPWKGKG